MGRRLEIHKTHSLHHTQKTISGRFRRAQTWRRRLECSFPRGYDQDLNLRAPCDGPGWTRTDLNVRAPRHGPVGLRRLRHGPGGRWLGLVVVGRGGILSGRDVAGEARGAVRAESVWSAQPASHFRVRVEEGRDPRYCIAGATGAARAVGVRRNLQEPRRGIHLLWRKVEWNGKIVGGRRVERRRAAVRDGGHAAREGSGGRRCSCGRGRWSEVLKFLFPRQGMDFMEDFLTLFTTVLSHAPFCPSINRNRHDRDPSRHSIYLEFTSLSDRRTILTKGRFFGRK
jgi:hypothetical protein